MIVNSKIVNTTSNYYCFVSSPKIIESIVNTMWRGQLSVTEEGTGSSIVLPECVVQCISGQPALGSDPKQVR